MSQQGATRDESGASLLQARSALQSSCGAQRRMRAHNVFELVFAFYVVVEVGSASFVSRCSWTDSQTRRGGDMYCRVVPITWVSRVIVASGYLWLIHDRHMRVKRKPRDVKNRKVHRECSLKTRNIFQADYSALQYTSVHGPRHGPKHAARGVRCTLEHVAPRSE